MKWLYRKSTTTEPIYSRWLTKEKVFYLVLCSHVYCQISIEIRICSWQYFQTYCKTYEITKWLEQMWLPLSSYLCTVWVTALPLSMHLKVWILAEWMKAKACQSELIASYCVATTININNIALTQLLRLRKFELQILVSEPYQSHIKFLNLSSHFWATRTPQVLQLLSLYLFTLFYCHQNPEF